MDAAWYVLIGLNSSVATVTMPWARLPRNHGLILGQAKLNWSPG